MSHLWSGESSWVSGDWQGREGVQRPRPKGPPHFPGLGGRCSFPGGNPEGPGQEKESWPWTPAKEPGSPQDPGWEADKQHSGGCTSYLVKRGLGRVSLQSVVRAGHSSRE